MMVAAAVLVTVTGRAEQGVPDGAGGKDFEPVNKLVDFAAFAEAAGEARRHRASRRVSEAQFIEMAGKEGTIVLDTRSAAKFALLHVEGAVNLNFSDITKDALEKAIPAKDTPILIYCNNNFEKEPRAFPAKRAETALNIPTFITLHAYGYRNVYELGPLLDVRTTRIPLTGTKLARN